MPAPRYLDDDENTPTPVLLLNVTVQILKPAPSDTTTVHMFMMIRTFIVESAQLLPTNDHTISSPDKAKFEILTSHIV
jgi:hypothetical protein